MLSFRLVFKIGYHLDERRLAFGRSTEAKDLHKEVEFLGRSHPVRETEVQRHDGVRLDIVIFSVLDGERLGTFNPRLFVPQVGPVPLRSGARELQEVRLDGGVMRVSPVNRTVGQLFVTLQRDGDGGCGATVVVMVVRVGDRCWLHVTFIFVYTLITLRRKRHEFRQYGGLLRVFSAAAQKAGMTQPSTERLNRLSASS